jgi:hypothetical protein
MKGENVSLILVLGKYDKQFVKTVGDAGDPCGF